MDDTTKGPPLGEQQIEIFVTKIYKENLDVLVTLILASPRHFGTKPD